MKRLLLIAFVGFAVLFASAWTGLLGDRAQFSIADLSDARPAKTVLLIGNSRTSANALPAMLRRISDAAKDPQRLEVTLLAFDGASMESQWRSEECQRKLAGKWNEVIVQGESRGQSTPELALSFETFGEQLLRTAHPDGGPPRLIVNWAYDPGAYPNGGRAEHFAQVEAAHRRIAADTGARLIDVGDLWERARLDHPEIALTRDFNHPTIAGTYLFALAIYSALAGRTVATLDYAPSSLSPATAADLRKEVDDFNAIMG